MSNQSVTFTINLGGNAYKGVLQLDNAVEQVIGSVKNATSVFDKLGRNALNFDVITNSVSKVSQAFQSLVGTSLDFEQQQANLRTLLNGDAEATDNLIGKIREYGKATVYDRSGLIEAQKTMMAFGLDAEYAFGKLKNIGDIALGDKQKMQSLALAFSQMSSTGKLMGQDLLQMINAGFNPLEVISQKTGKSIAELKDEMSKGAISAELVAQAFEWATEEGGRFYQGAETAAETTAGKIAKVKDQIDDFKISLFEATNGITAWIAEMGNMFVPIAQMYPLVAGIGKGVVNTVKWCSVHWAGFVTLVRTGVAKIALNLQLMKVSITTAGGFFMWLRGVATVACRGISTAIMSIPIVGWIAAIVTVVIAVITAIVAGIKKLWDNCEGFRRVVMGVWETIKAVFQNIWTVIKAVATVIWEAILKPVFDAVSNAIKKAWEAVKTCIDWIVSAAQKIWETMVGVVKSIGDFFSGLWNRVIEGVRGIIDWVTKKLGNIGAWLKKHIVEPVSRIFTKLWDVIKGIFDKIKEKLMTLLKPVIDLWNKVFKKDQIKDLGSAYKVGAEKGSESYRQSKEKEKKEAGDIDTGKDTLVLDVKDGKDGAAGLNGKDGASGKAGKDLSGGNLGKNAGTVAGKAQQITIKLENMVGTMNFNGGIRENASDVESRLTEMLARILGMAETAA